MFSTSDKNFLRRLIT